MRLLIAVVALNTAYLGLVVAAQIQQPNGSPSRKAEVVVDGAKTPESIPDVVAFRHFFAVISKRQGTDGVDDMRRRSYIAAFLKPSCGANNDDDRTLADTQIDALFTLADTLADRVSRSTDQQEISRLVLGAVSELDAVLGLDGAQKVRRHVYEHVKRRITLTRIQK